MDSDSPEGGSGVIQRSFALVSRLVQSVVVIERR